MKKLQFLILFQSVVVVALVLGGCASSASSQSFTRATTRTALDVYYGEIVSTKPVDIEGEATILGRLGGAAIGYAIGLGDSRGFSSSERIAAAAGSVGGSIAGEAIERAVKREDGIEIIVRLDHDETIAVVQANDVEFSPGQRVQVLFGNSGSTRVQPL